MQTTRHFRRIKAGRYKVYEALIDPVAVAHWRVPDGMSCKVHEFEPKEGGRIRVSLTYTSEEGLGKSTTQTDTYSGYFVKLRPGKEVVEVDEFETTDPNLRGEMRLTMTLTEQDGTTDLHVIHEGLPDTVAAADNDLGWTMALDKLAAWVEKPSNN